MSESIEFINYENLPQETEWLITGEANSQGRKYFILDGVRTIPVGERVVKFVQALVLTVLTSGFALFFVFVCELWVESVSGKAEITAFVNANTIPQDRMKALGFKKIDSPVKGRVFQAGEFSGLMIEYLPDNDKNNQVDEENKETPRTPRRRRGSSVRANRDVQPLSPQQEEAEVIAKMKKCGLWLAYAVGFQDNEKVVMAAIEQDPFAIKHAAPHLKNTLKFALAAVTRNGNTLAHVSEVMRKTQAVVEAAIRNDPSAAEHALMSVEGMQEPGSVPTHPSSPRKGVKMPFKRGTPVRFVMPNQQGS